MSGALPSVDFKAVNFQSEQRTLRSTTDSGKTFRRQIDGQRWTFTCLLYTSPSPRDNR